MEAFELSIKPVKRHTIHVSKIINAPLPFVYKWCTDYREDDNRITGSTNQRKILQRTKLRVIYLSIYGGKRKPKYGVNIVALKPPTAWHLDFVGEEDDETGDYQLTRLGAGRTRLSMVFEERYKVRGGLTKAEDTKHTNQIWDKFVAALEKEYRKKA